VYSTVDSGITITQATQDLTNGVVLPDRIAAVAGPTLLSNTIKLGRTGSCDEMIHGRVRTLTKLNSPLSSRVRKSTSCPKCMPSFSAATFFSQKNKQNSNFRTAATDLNLYRIKGELALFVLVSGYVC